MSRLFSSRLVVVMLVGVALAGCSSVGSFAPAPGPGRVAEVQKVDYPRVIRPVLNPSGGRDQLAHMLYVAESAPTAARRGRGYRELALVLIKAGRGEEAMRAYEAGALQGDGPSASAIMKAHAELKYVPMDLNAMVELVYVPRARDRGTTSAALLLADLVAAGTIDEQRYGTSAYWLQVAADNGSTAGVSRLAELTAKAGRFQEASDLYASVDATHSRVDRALSLARHSYLGDSGPRDTRLALGWLDYASRLDMAATAQVAASLYRKGGGSESAQAALLKVALAGGVDPQGSGGAVSRLRQAKTDAERQAIIAEMRAAADGGSSEAALNLASVLFALGDASSTAEGYRYLEAAINAGNGAAAAEAAKRLASLLPDAPEAKSLVAVLDKAAAGGMADAMWAMGELYAWGGPVAADQARSLEYIRLAADAGHIEAQLRIGLHFAQTKANPENAELAQHYLAAAAKQGSATAKAYLEELQTTG